VAAPTGGEVWAFLETVEEGLHETATQAASEARRVARLLEGRACGVIPGMPERRLLEELAPFGLGRIYALRGEPGALRTAEENARAVAALTERRSPSFLLFAATPLGCETAARVAARCKSGFVSDCVDFAREAEGFTARRNVCGGRAHAKVAWRGPRPWVATVSLDALEAVPESPGQLAEVVAEDGDFGAPRTELVRRWRVEPREVDISEARVVVGIGKPILQRPADLSIVEEVAERLGAVVGGSRIVVDAGLLPRARQIGASGKWLAADVYLACGVSGSSYHMMGVKAVKHLVAVNLDRSAPIFQHAELGVVGDLFEVLPALYALLAPGKPKGGDEQ
jgi:electron transfer flavoprotein alpha subunit